VTKAEQTYFTYLTPLGPMTVASDGTAVTHVLFGTHVLEGRAAPTELTNRTANELQEYLAGKRTAFDIPLAPAGTEFQRAVWKALQNIPYGQTRSYADIAAVVGNPKATRAVGSANNRNPIAVLIPCHRVVGSNGKLTGYAGGLALKQRLLDLERAHC
jgi:methylated-DNA-[protein]-cysteine S-methyltransferase